MTRAWTEVVAGAINGMAEHRPVPATRVVAGSLGVLIAASLWWLYFGLVSSRMHRGNRGIGWLYGHLPLIIGIAGAGAAVRTVVADSGRPLTSDTRWLLVGSVALALASTHVLTHTLVQDAAQSRSTRTLRRPVLPAAVVVLMLGFTSLGALGILGSITVVALGLVILSIWIWLDLLEASS